MHQRGGGNSGGSTVGVFSTSKNLPARHKYKSPKQFELKQSWKTQRSLNARWATPVYSVFEDENSKASDEELVKQKKRIKKNHRIDIIATNFVWEQLNIFCNFPNLFFLVSMLRVSLMTGTFFLEKCNIICLAWVFYRTLVCLRY